VIARLAFAAGLLASAALAQEDLRAKFFQDVTHAKLLNGSVVNCCGQGDAVKVRFIDSDRTRHLIYAEIIDTMRSVYGRRGDIVVIETGVTTVDIFTPFDDPIVFISASNKVLCLSAPERG
jgi:hypothetical protein